MFVSLSRILLFAEHVKNALRVSGQKSTTLYHLGNIDDLKYLSGCHGRLHQNTTFKTIRMHYRIQTEVKKLCQCRRANQHQMDVIYQERDQEIKDARHSRCCGEFARSFLVMLTFSALGLTHATFAHIVSIYNTWIYSTWRFLEIQAKFCLNYAGSHQWASRERAAQSTSQFFCSR